VRQQILGKVGTVIFFTVEFLQHITLKKLLTLVDFYPRDVVSGVLATATWLAGWLAGWVAGCLTQPVMYQNDYTYLKIFSTV